MENENQSRLVLVASGTYSDASMIKLLLENEDIPAMLKDDFMGTIAPYATSPGGAGSVKVLVFEKDFEQALKIIEEFNKSRNI
jgi:hypothetical protein